MKGITFFRRLFASTALLMPLLAFSQLPQVAITAITEHPSLDNIRRGIVDELAAQGFKDGTTIQIVYRSAQGSSATAAQIAKQFVAQKPAVIVPITTPSAQAIAASTRTIPVVFAGITDPVAAKLVKGFEPTHSNITGVSDALPLEPQIALMLKLKPQLKHVGFIYSPGEINSTSVMKKLQQLLQQKGIELIAVPAQKTADVAPAARSLKGKVELIYTTTDNNIVSGYEALVRAANESKILLVASDPDSVSRGAAAALGISYYQFGHEAGKIVSRILKGEQVGEIAPVISNSTELLLNPAAAKAQGTILSPSLIDSAAKIIGKNPV